MLPLDTEVRVYPYIGFYLTERYSGGAEGVVWGVRCAEDSDVLIEVAFKVTLLI